MVAFSDFCSREGVKSWSIDDGGLINIKEPKFFGRTPEGERDDSPDLDVSHRRFCSIQLLPIQAAVIHNAIVNDSCYFIMTGKEAIHPDSYNPETEVCFLEARRIFSINPAEKTVISLRQGQRRVGRAISIVSQCHGNYAHFITETLPILLIAQEIAEFRNAPLIMGGWMHRNYIEAAALFCDSMREIIYLKYGEGIDVDELLAISPTAYTPAEHRKFYETGTPSYLEKEIFQFSRFAMKLVQEAARSRILPNKKPGYKKIYIVRRSISNNRNMVNNHEVERIASNFGFLIIDMEKMSFAEQVSLFQAADIIIVPMGAALINAVFTKEDCKIITLASHYKDVNYNYFNNFLGTIERDAYHIIGPQAPRFDERVHPFNADYLADTSALESLLTKLVPMKEASRPQRTRGAR